MEVEVTVSLVLICCLAFFVAGCIDSIAGGGGLITLPTLILLGLPAHHCLGTAKLSSCLGSLSALWTFWKKGQVIKSVSLLGAITSYLGAVIGSGTTLLLSNESMTLILIFMLPVGLVISIFCGSLSLKDAPLPSTGLWWRISAIGLGVGFYEGFFGPAAGSFFLIGIHLLLKAGLVKASGTAKVFNIAGNLGGVTAFASAGTVIYTLAIPCAIASIIGNRIGALMAVKVGPKLVRYVLYIVLVLLLISLIVRFAR